MPFGQPLIVLQCVDSTNNYAANMLRSAHVAEGTVVMAHKQTEGRGQRGTDWRSNPGENLMFSLVLKPTRLVVSQQFTISQKISLGIVQWLRTLWGFNARIKWPNDILVNNQKLGGILIENGVRGNHLEYSIVGIGLNINQVEFNPAFHATSLRQLTGTNLEPKELLRDLLVYLERVWKTPSDEKLESEYLQKLIGWNSMLTYCDREGVFTAQIAGLGPHGELILERPDGTQKAYGIKEVELLRESL